MKRRPTAYYLPRVKRLRDLDGRWIFKGYVILERYGKQNRILDPMYFETYELALRFALSHPAVKARRRLYE